VALSRRGCWSEALQAYAGAVQRRPRWPEARSAVAETLLAIGRPLDAAASAREALRLQPDLVAASETLARALAMTGRPEEAAAVILSVLRRDPRAADRPRFQEAWFEVVRDQQH
jgi:cytochrome c-type biogenesis protein CcmH/NrfG